MKQLFISMILVLNTMLISTLSKAQYGELQGKVTDAQTGEGLPYATIKVLNNGIMVNYGLTDTNGNYTIKPLLPSDYYEVRTSYVSYHADTVKNVSVHADETRFFYIKLRLDSDAIKKVEINQVH